MSPSLNRLAIDACALAVFGLGWAILSDAHPAWMTGVVVWEQSLAGVWWLEVNS